MAWQLLATTTTEEKKEAAVYSLELWSLCCRYPSFFSDNFSSAVQVFSHWILSCPPPAWSSTRISICVRVVSATANALFFCVFCVKAWKAAFEAASTNKVGNSRNGFEAVVVAYARSAKAEDNLISRQKTTINRSASALGVTAAQTPVKKAAEVTKD